MSVDSLFEDAADRCTVRRFSNQKVGLGRDRGLGKRAPCATTRWPPDIHQCSPFPPNHQELIPNITFCSSNLKPAADSAHIRSFQVSSPTARVAPPPQHTSAMASASRRTSNFHPRVSAVHEIPGSRDQDKEEIWKPMLDNISSGKRLPEKSLLVLGMSAHVISVIIAVC